MLDFVSNWGETGHLDVIRTSYFQITSFSDFENGFKRILVEFAMDFVFVTSAKNAIMGVIIVKMQIFFQNASKNHIWYVILTS